MSWKDVQSEILKQTGDKVHPNLIKQAVVGAEFRATFPELLREEQVL